MTADAKREKIEITPKMLDAGLTAYWEFSPEFDESPRLVMAVYSAMFSARPSESVA